MRKQEEAMRIMEALTGVDEELLARCEAEDTAGAGADTANVGDGAAASKEQAGRRTDRQGKGNRHMWQYLSRCAAVLALVAVGAVSWRGFRISKDLIANDSASGGSPQAFMADGGSGFDVGNEVPENGMPGDRISEDMVCERDIREEVREMQLMPAEAGNSMNGAGGTDDLDGLEDFDGTDGLDESNVQGGSESAKLGNIGNTAVTEAAGCRAQTAFTARNLTVDEARQTALLGDYVPTALPAGCDFEYVQYDEENGWLRILLSKGDVSEILLDFIQVDSGAVETVDIQKPETYDERLYTKPFADTVPEEYRETFSSPVFARDDFSLEIVCSRVLSYSGDSGDTSTSWGHFNVLYDGVLVCFDGRGTPEEIWEMFSSISKQ